MMCETNGDTVSTTEQPRATSNNVGEDTRQENGFVKFDIGEFVHTQRKINLLLKRWIRTFNTVSKIICWRSPYTSLFWLIFCCIMAVKSPVCFIIMPLVYIVIVMFMSGIKQQAKHNTTLKNRPIKKIIEEKKKNLTERVEKQVQEDLREFISLLVQLDALCEWISNSLENCNRIINWEDFKTSLCVFVGVLLSVLILMFIPLTVILLVIVISVFCLNQGFRPVAMHALSSVTGSAEYLLVITGLRELFPIEKSKKKSSSNNINDPQDEWYDAQSDGRTQQSSDEEFDEDINEESTSKKKLDSSSILSQLADYRRKQKKLNSGKCSHCQVPFSSILKKRQYCRHCGEGFCSKCCSDKVKRSVFGATAPAAYEETVLVCRPCYDQLMNVTDNPGPSW